MIFTTIDELSEEREMVMVATYAAGRRMLFSWTWKENKKKIRDELTRAYFRFRIDGLNRRCKLDEINADPVATALKD